MEHIWLIGSGGGSARLLLASQKNQFIPFIGNSTAKKKVKINHFCIFLPKYFSVNDFLGIILRCSPPREVRLRLGSVTTALMDSLQQPHPGYVYKYIEKLDTDKQAYGWLPVMTSSSGGQIGALCAESFCERILSASNEVCHDWSMLLDTEEINMLVVLRMNREFIQHVREI